MRSQNPSSLTCFANSWSDRWSFSFSVSSTRISRTDTYRDRDAFRMAALATQKNGGAVAFTSKRMSYFATVLFQSSTERHQYGFLPNRMQSAVVRCWPSTTQSDGL